MQSLSDSRIVERREEARNVDETEPVKGYLEQEAQVSRYALGRAVPEVDGQCRYGSWPVQRCSIDGQECVPPRLASELYTGRLRDCSDFLFVLALFLAYGRVWVREVGRKQKVARLEQKGIKVKVEWRVGCLKG